MSNRVGNFSLVVATTFVFFTPVAHAESLANVQPSSALIDYSDKERDWQVAQKREMEAMQVGFFDRIKEKLQQVDLKRQLGRQLNRFCDIGKEHPVLFMKVPGELLHLPDGGAVHPKEKTLSDITCQSL